MKRFKNCKRILSGILALSMSLSLCATSFAAPPESPLAEINYVSLGDSMTNGYGLAGYNGNNGVLDYGDVSYANQFAEWLVDAGYADTVNHHQLAMSGCRAEDIHWFLEFDHESAQMRDFVNYISSGWTWNEDEWYSVFNIGDYRTCSDMCSDNNRSSAAASNILASGYDSPYATQEQKDAADCINNGTGLDNGYVHYTNDNQVAIVSEYIQTAIKEADIVSMAVGNSNFGTFMFDQIANAVGYSGSPSDAMKFSIERALTECPEAIKEKVLTLLDELYDKIEDYMGIELDYDEAVEPEDYITAAVANAAVYAGISYVLNYAGAVDAILKLNPDVEIIEIGLMNTYLSTTSQTTEPTIGSLLEVIFPPLNAFIAALPTYMQATGNDVYKNATFYYAEAPEVACMVEVYGTDFYNQDGTCNTDSITRQRFFRDLKGLIQGMLGDTDKFGSPLDYTLSFPELCAYDDKNDIEKAAYAYVNPSKAVTCAVYLAFEKATLDAGRNSAVTLSSVMGLGNMDASQFAGVLDKLNQNMGVSAPTYAGVSFQAIASIFNNAANNNYSLVSEISANQVAGVYTADDSSKLDVAKTIVQGITDDARNEATIENMAKQGVYNNISDAQYEAAYSGFAAANSIPYNWEDFQQYGGDSYTAFVEGVKATAWATYGEGAIATAKNTIIDESAAILVGSIGYVQRLCQLLALPDALGSAMAEDDKATSWFGLSSRCVIGDGLGGHPSSMGHDSLFEAMKNSYDNGYTSKDETIQNIKDIKDIVSEYYDDAYEFAYATADEKGYIDITVKAVENIIATVKALDFANIPMTDAFKAKLNAELNAVVTSLEKIKTILAEDKASDIDGLRATIPALMEDLQGHLVAVKGLLDQVGIDIKHELAKGTHKPYNPDADDKYVAIGGYTVYGTGLDLLGGENTYAKLIDADSKSVYNPNGKLLPSGAIALIEANAADIEAADLITYQLDASSFIDAILSPTEIDWDNYFDETEKALINDIMEEAQTILTTSLTDYAVEEIKAKIKAAVIANYPGKTQHIEAIVNMTADILAPYLAEALSYAEEKRQELVSKIPELDETTRAYAEKIAYTVVSYAADTKAAIEKIQEINPDATLVVVGMYNPAKGLKVDMNGTVIDAEAYAEYIVDATNIYYNTLAAANDGFAFVDVADAETTGFGGEVVGVDSILANAAALYPSMHANQAGHEYIKDQILASFVCDYSAYAQLDESYHNIVCALCGDVKTKEYHTFVDNTCDKCGYEYIAPSYVGGFGGGSVNQFIIKFNTNGGSSVANVTVKKGELLEEPSAPTKDGFTFEGWYMDKALTNKYDFSEPVTKSFTLYAKWVEKVTDASTIFTDVDKDAWYYDVVNQIVAKGLMVGLSETEFGPQATLTRGMFVTVLHRVEGTPQVEGELVFTDVAADQYYAEAVKWASANGIVSGITETDFAPNKEVTREQMAAILARYVEFKAIEVPEEGDATYTDADAISEYAKDAVLVAKKLGILVGNADGTFAPKSNATRAEAAALFVRLLGVMGE